MRFWGEVRVNSIKFYKSFSFNVYRFEKYHLTDKTNEPVSMHYIGCLIDGSAKITSKNETIELKPNDVFYIPKGLKYYSQWFSENDRPIEFYSFGFEVSPINKSYVLQKINCSEKAKIIFDELCQEIPITDKGIGKLYYFFGEIAETMKQTQKKYIDSTLEKAIEYVQDNSNCKISDVAKYCNVCTSEIYALFKKYLNKTPNDLRCEILCEKAVTLLTTTDKSVQEISDMLGFSSTSYFRKILYRYTNNTPRDIRKKTEKI